MPDQPQQNAENHPGATSTGGGDRQGRPQSLLDRLLLLHPGTPKARAKQWILAGRVTVNQQVVRKPHLPVAEGDCVELGTRHATTLDCGSGWQIHPRVCLLHIDPFLAVVNKGPGLLAVPAVEGELSALTILADSLAGALKARDRSVAARSIPPVYRRLEPLPVHRLDQYTSGVFCMATSPAARQHLIDQLKAHTMRREYVAYVVGRPATPKGTWRHWLELSHDELRQQVITEARAKIAGVEAQEAITHYEVIAEYPLERRGIAVSKLRLRLETGRKHQIRVQAAHAGVPLIGDRAYNPDLRRPVAERTGVDFARQALHAERLTLEHPGPAHERMSWTAALPKDLRQLEAALQSGRA
jgi:23S rRNA pseudouridine1911/1915/1917 synthase